MVVSLVTVPTSWIMESLSELTKVDNQGTEICKYKSSDEDGNKVGSYIYTGKNFSLRQYFSDSQAIRCLVNLLRG